VPFDKDGERLGSPAEGLINPVGRPVNSAFDSAMNPALNSAFNGPGERVSQPSKPARVSRLWRFVADCV